MDDNPLVEAVRLYEAELDAVADVMFAVGGAECLEEFDERLHREVMDLTTRSYDAVAKLGPRAREARLNLIWKDFLKKHGKEGDE
jgi:hypothetical protein